MVTVDNIDGYGPGNGRWWGIFSDGILLEASPSKRAAQRMAAAYRLDPGLVTRKLAEMPR